MNLLELAILYGIGGLISAFVLGRREREAGRRRPLQLVLALLLWPLWLPVALTRKEPEATDRISNVSASEQALRQGFEAVKGTPLEKLLPLESVERISLELRRVVERDRELAQLLTQPSFDLQAARVRVSELEQNGTQPRALVMAQRHVENVERLAALHQRDQLLNAELEDWLSTLRTQLVLARYSGTSAAGIGDIFAEICARVEVLGSTLEEPAIDMPNPPDLSWPNTYCS